MGCERSHSYPWSGTAPSGTAAALPPRTRARRRPEGVAALAEGGPMSSGFAGKPSYGLARIRTTLGYRKLCTWLCEPRAIPTAPTPEPFPSRPSSCTHVAPVENGGDAKSSEACTRVAISIWNLTGLIILVNTVLLTRLFSVAKGSVSRVGADESGRQTEVCPTAGFRVTFL